jgi:hypothetical protein
MVSRDTVRTPRQVFGAMLRYYRERAGLTRPELARQICKSESLTCIFRGLALGPDAVAGRVFQRAGVPGGPAVAPGGRGSTGPGGFLSGRRGGWPLVSRV